MPILMGALKLLFIWVLSSLIAASIAKSFVLIRKGARQLKPLLTIRKLKPAK